MTGKQVLAFEADPIYADLLKEQVELRGGQFEAVSDGIEGLDRAAELHPDLIYLCVELPKVSGFSICNKLRSNRKLSTIPIILSSAEAGEETFAKHRKLKKSADEYIHKPFDGAQIGPVLGNFIGNGDLEQESADDESDSAIIVADDDEFEIEDVEMVEAGDDEVSVQMNAEDIPGIDGDGENVDNEIDAFTDEAFAALELGDEKSAGPSKKEEEPSPRPVQTKGTTPAPAPAPAEESAAFSEENEVLRRRVDELEDALERAVKRQSDQESDVEGLNSRNKALIDKVSQLERELAESKASGGGEGVSSREFLELRETLNKKDRELLDLRDAMNKREKQLLESREKLTETARHNADLEETNIAQARRAHELEDTIRSLKADKELLAQKADDLQGRVERTQEKLSSTEDELDRVAFEKREEAKRLTKEKEDALAELTQSKDAELEELAQEKERQRQEALEELEEKLDQERQEALENLRAELEQEHERAREEALTQQRLRHEEQLEQREQELNAQKDEALSQAEQEREEQLENQKQDYESRLAETIQSHQETVDELESQAQQQATRIETLEETLQSLEEKKRSLEAELAETKEQLGNTHSRLAETEDELRGAVEELEETQDRVALLEGELDEFSDVMTRNGRIVLKVREALNIIMTQLLEEVELNIGDQDVAIEDDEFLEVDEVEDIEG